MSDDEQLDHIEKILVARYWLFGIIIIAICACALAIYSNSSALFNMSKRVEAQNERSRQNTALIEASIQQQIIFQATIAQVMDKMSRDNPKFKVPKVPVKPPMLPGAAPFPSQTPNPPSDEELTRVRPKPSATPTKSAPRRTKPKPKPSPTPKRFVWPWQVKPK